MEDEIYLSDIFRVLWNGRYLIIGIFIIAVLAAGVISFSLMTPTYKASCIVAPGNFGDPIYTNQDSAITIMLSDEYLLDVVEQLDFEVPPEEFRGFKNSISIDKGSSSLVVISVERKSGQEGVEIIETIVELFAERSEESYNKHTDILLDELASFQRRLEIADMDVNQTRQALEKLEGAPGTSQTENEIRISRTLELLNGQETRRSSLEARELELQSKLALNRHLEIIQEAREPVAPMASKRALIVAVAGMLGLMVGVLAAFLREGLRRPVS